MYNVHKYNVLTIDDVWSTHDPEEGIEQAETLTKECSLPILNCTIIPIKNLDAENNLRVPKPSSPNQIVDQQSFRQMTKTVLGPHFALGVQ